MGVYLMVMAPICLLEGFLFFTDTPNWIRATAGAVVLFSILGFIRGYGRRLVLCDEGAEWRTVLGSQIIRWADVRSVGTYIPGGGLGATEYVYITRRDAPPEGKWQIDADTIQVQNQSGLMDAIAVFCPASLRPSGTDAAGL